MLKEGLNRSISCPDFISSTPRSHDCLSSQECLNQRRDMCMRLLGNRTHSSPRSSKINCSKTELVGQSGSVRAASSCSFMDSWHNSTPSLGSRKEHGSNFVSATTDTKTDLTTSSICSSNVTEGCFGSTLKVSNGIV